MVYEDKNLFKAAGPVWHHKERLKDHLPKTYEALIKPLLGRKVGITDGSMGMDSISPAFAMSFLRRLTSSPPTSTSERSWISKKTYFLKKACGVLSPITAMAIKNARSPFLPKPRCFCSSKDNSHRGKPTLRGRPLVYRNTSRYLAGSAKNGFH